MNTLYIMVGCPASGKSWFAKHKMLSTGCCYVSRDDICFNRLKPGENYFAHEKEVYNVFINSIAALLSHDDDVRVIADATHICWPSRWKLLNNLQRKGIDLDKINIIPIVMVTDVETIYARNAQREGLARAPEETIRDMIESYRHPITDPFKYTAIMEVRN